MDVGFPRLSSFGHFKVMVVWLSAVLIWLMYHRLFEVWTSFAMFRPVPSCVAAIAIAWVFSSKEKRPLGNIFTPALLFYTVVITLSTLLSPFTTVFDNIWYYNWLVYMLIFLILMTSIKSERDLRIIVTSFTISMFLLMVHSYKAYLNGAVHTLDGAPRLLGFNLSYRDVNIYGSLLICAMPLLLPLLTLCKKNWHYLFLIAYPLLALRSVQLTGSRTAYIMACTLFVLPAVLSRNRFKLLPIILLAMPICWFALPETHKNRFRSIWDSSISEMGNANKQGRIDGFFNGLQNWSSYPLTGVGPQQHPYGPGGDGYHLAHNLAGQVAGETGTLGIIAFLGVLSCFGINHYTTWKNYKYLQTQNLGQEGLYCWRVSVAVMYAVAMLLLQGLGLHTAFDFIWPLFGVFQAIATMLMQEKVNAVVQGTLRPSLLSVR